MKEKLDVFKILSEKKDDRLDVLEILRPDMKDNQEQHNAPDFDLFNDIGRIAAQQQPEMPAPAEPQPQVEIQPAPDPDHETVYAKKQPASCQEKSPTRRSVLRKIIMAAVLITVIVLFAAFVICGIKVRTDSMAPLISKGDWVIVNKIAKSYDRGDVIVFKDYNEQECIARIIAGDGDLIDINKAGGLIINNKAETREKLVGETFITDTNVQYPVLVGEDEFFVLGDNREDSADSRNYHIGNINNKQIIGKVIYCYKRIK